jgi:hypothetical protein
LASLDSRIQRWQLTNRGVEAMISGFWKYFGAYAGLFLSSLVIPFGSWGASADLPDGRAILKPGTLDASLAVGFWQAVKFANHAPSLNRSAVFVLPYVGIVVTDEFRAGLLSGNLEVGVEPLFARFTQPFAAEAAGGSFLVKYNFLSFGRWVPYWDAGAGALWTNLAPRIPEQSAQFNFVLETGPGAHYLLTTSLAARVGVRYHHISNADLGQRNTGLNAVLAYVGLSWFFPH